MFMFTGATHFSPMKHDCAAMIPDPLPKSLLIIHLTGLTQIAGAVGLLIPRIRRIAGTALALQLTAMFPANVSAARRGIPFRGRAPTPLWLRGPAQLVYVGALWWTSIHTSPGGRRKRILTPRAYLIAGIGTNDRAFVNPLDQFFATRLPVIPARTGDLGRLATRRPRRTVADA